MTFALIERNLKLYLRDRMGVFFSFLSVFMVLLLYALFLGDNTVENVQESIGRVVPGIEELVNTWLLAGIVMISTVTVPISALAVFMEDKDNRIIDDFYTAPIKRSRLALSYLLSSVIIASVMTMVNFFLGQGYMLLLGFDTLPLMAILKLLGLIVVSSFTFSSFFFLLTFLFNTARSFGSLGTIVGTLVGFFGGIYVPIGVLAPGVVWVMNFVPVAHAVTLFRHVYTSVTLPAVFDGAPSIILDDFRIFFGIDIQYGSYVMPMTLIFVVLIGYGLLFFLISTFLLNKQKRA